MHTVVKQLCAGVLACWLSTNLMAQTAATTQASLEQFQLGQYIHWYPAIKQAQMRDAWLAQHQYGEWSFSGAVTPQDRTVVTPQADVNYGYAWFNLGNGPAVVTMPAYEHYYSLSVFSMDHHMEVIVGPKKPVVIMLPGQVSPLEDAHVIVVQTVIGLAFTRQVIVDNEADVLALASNISMRGGDGKGIYIIPQFSSETAAAGQAMIADYVATTSDGSKAFGAWYEGVGDIDRAGGVYIGQLGTQARYANYHLYALDPETKTPLSGSKSYQVTVPGKGLMRNGLGYWSITVYSAADKYLISNPLNRYSVSSYNAVPNPDGSYTVTINPDGSGANAIPTAGQGFYAVLRVYEPVDGIDYPPLTVPQN